MMSGNPNWWSINNSMFPHQLSSSQFVNIVGASSNPSPIDHHNPNQDFPVRSWSQLLLGGGHGGGGEGVGDEGEERLMESSSSLFHQLDNKKNPCWDHLHDRVKQEGCSMISCNNNQIHYSHNHAAEDHHYNNRSSSSSSSSAAYCWPPLLVSSPATSCITSLSNNSSSVLMSFSAGVQNNNNKQLIPCNNHGRRSNNNNQDRSSAECKDTSDNNGGVSNKKSRVQQSSTHQPAMKVRKEKLGDRITALHQLVSPFGKTDTASVLSEAIGHIGFLQGQIEALSSPYMRNGSAGRTIHRHQHSVQERSSMFHEAHSQAENSHENGVAAKDLRSRGLCLVPISCTQNVASSDNGADYWAQPALGGGF